MSANSSDEITSQLEDMFGDDSEGNISTEGSYSTSSASSDEEDNQISEGGQVETDEWTERGQLQTLAFNSVGHFNIGPAEFPLDYFNLFFNSTFMAILVSSINTHGLRMMLENNLPNSRAQNFKNTNESEVRVFLALIFHMGHIRLNRLNDYWKTDILFNLSFARFMSRDRFLILLRNLTYDDNSNSYSNTDPNRFVKPIICFFNALMKSLVSPPKNLTIDESVILWRGRLSIRQYIKNKRHKYGVKMYVLTDTNGITQKMHMYNGANDPELRGKGHADKVVMMLMEDYLNAGHSLYTDNFYTSVQLAEQLLQKRTYLTGTLRANRKKNPAITRARVARGTYLTRYNARGVCVTNYRDKRNVLMISTEHESNFVDFRNRRGQVVSKPKVIVEYNKYMKGVDRKDQMLSYYPSITKSTRWYKKIIIHVMQVMLLNAFMMFKRQMNAIGDNGKAMTLLDFRLHIVKQLLQLDDTTNRQTNFRNTMQSSSSVGNKIKLTTGDDVHLPVELPKNEQNKTKRKDCKHCLHTRKIRKATVFYCPLCIKQPGLCLGCFRDFHRY